MKKRIVLAFAFSILVTLTFVQTFVTQVKPAGNKKWGYATVKDGIVIQPQFEKCYKFSESGWAPIYDSKQKQFYFINLKGEKLNTEVKDFKLQEPIAFGIGGGELKGFEEGMVPIKQGDKWGYLNTEGKLAIQVKYDRVTDFNGGYATVQNDDQYMVLDKQGKENLVDGAAVEVRSFSESLAPYRAADKKFGFIGTDGKIAIPAKFESVGYFVNGLAWAKESEKSLGYINTKGEWAVKPQFEVGKDFDKNNGLARIKTGDKWGYVSKTGEVMYPKDTEIYEDFFNGLARGRQNGKFGFLNAAGEWAIKPEFDGSRDFKNGYAAVKKGDTWGIIDTNGKWVIEPTFDGIKDMELVK